MASIKTNQAATRMHNDFEASATHLLPYDPVQKKRVDQAGGKCGSADISADATVEETNVSSFGTKKGAGSSGVSPRYHTKAEYDLLSKSQMKGSKTGGQVNEAKMGAPLARALHHPRKPSTTPRRQSPLPPKRKLMRR